MASKEKQKKKTGKKKEKSVKDESDETVVEETALAEEPEAASETDVVEGAEDSSEGVKRGRAVKEPPPPKNWRVEGLSPEGIRVILGRFVTREEAEPEMERLKEDGFYEKIRLVEAPIAAKA
ncbi:MAG: hypothetical protein IPK83_07845 [Planctomycetes bacterium]|nr:hypothetical protein [Planctomycetota bacterium]